MKRRPAFCSISPFCSIALALPPLHTLLEMPSQDTNPLGDLSSKRITRQSILESPQKRQLSAKMRNSHAQTHPKCDKVPRKWTSKFLKK